MDYVVKFKEAKASVMITSQPHQELAIMFEKGDEITVVKSNPDDLEKFIQSELNRATDLSRLQTEKIVKEIYCRFYSRSNVSVTISQSSLRLDSWSSKKSSSTFVAKLP
jgi:hypothetical protein